MSGAGDILVFNSGSSSLKFQLFRNDNGIPCSVLQGAVRGIGGTTRCEWRYGEQQQLGTITASDHVAAADYVLQLLDEQIEPQRSLLDGVTAIGHRVVHGADRFSEPLLLTPQSTAQLDTLSSLAPLHNPPALAVMDLCRRRLPLHPMVAVFDTSYFQELPDYVQRYALPAQWQETSHEIRRYGFHGLAHRSMAEQYCARSGVDPETSRLITLQLGHGCSIAALRDGYPLEISMGFTPLEGLIMATRPGDLDAGVLLHLLQQGGVSAEELNEGLNHRAGLLGLSGASSDMKELLQLEGEGHEGAILAIEAFVHRVRKYLGAYLAVLGGADAIIFGGGIGEHAPALRERICAEMAWCGIELDAEANQDAVGVAAVISTPASATVINVLPVDEESLIAQETLRCLATTTD
jgi:acetate kinase